MKTIYQVTFVDNSNCKCELIIEPYNDVLTFTASYGDYYGCVYDSINPTKIQKPLIKYWKQYNGKKEWDEEELKEILKKIKEEEERRKEKEKEKYADKINYDLPAKTVKWIAAHKNCDKLTAQKIFALMSLQNCVSGDIDYIEYYDKLNYLTLYGIPFACDIVYSNYYDGTCIKVGNNLFRITEL